MNNKMVVSIGIDIAKGIYHLHKENILHCDLVARNLLVIQNGNNLTIKIADFGLSHKLKDDEIYVGKNDSFIPFCWSAPEVIKEKVFSKKSDVWSFGATM